MTPQGNARNEEIGGAMTYDALHASIREAVIKKQGKVDDARIEKMIKALRKTDMSDDDIRLSVSQLISAKPLSKWIKIPLYIGAGAFVLFIVIPLLVGAFLVPDKQAGSNSIEATAVDPRERLKSYNPLEAALDPEFGTKAQFDEIMDTSRGDLPKYFGLEVGNVEVQYESPTGKPKQISILVQMYGTSAQDIRQALSKACDGSEEMWVKSAAIRGGTLAGKRCNAVFRESTTAWFVDIEQPQSSTSTVE